MKNVLLAGVIALGSATACLAEGVTHHIAVHVDENDPQVMNMALNNVQNVTAYYKEQGDEVVVEVVAYGPGLNMYVPGKSPVADRISAMSLEMDNLTFAACGNTLRNMSKKLGHDVELMDEANVVPSGVVRLVELQEQGFAYIRP
ncbi:DsrE family protein [Actibacterium lipolyticum]|uniref:DsrE/DsrF-like family protein n=1 Tax=Actibacterium lipolyticum TaxID=1524263 RepID=A0A238JTL4_9RHOB|nr:DsrE family protein [Actibacterium lipolyticum]SMX33086.1 DsrE/DsrF-like family protein [Actibacterium lipolyticum]